MAPVKKAYSRPTARKILKAHSNCNVTKNLDVLIYLDYLRFMQSYGPLNHISLLFLPLTQRRIIKEAAIESKQAGERTITPNSVKKATADALARFKS
ncbi:hypothetical protein B0T11DRAFT_325624 [Plectosphaerella cucumerina]|uniref:Uncharacterized protein n=1 Tax=Plectosphaerella cucumerina TaxID=40658 RepID=A0A8K0TPW2_9PEZI|nr:hypothetical protein B0T11DRAFT_325624 [Plectosphaerella cucumerina]